MNALKKTTDAATAAQPNDARELAYAIGIAVHALRTDHGWSQGDLAKEAGMRQPHVSRLEGANNLPTLPVLLRIANALGARLVVKFEKIDAQPETT